MLDSSGSEHFLLWSDGGVSFEKLAGAACIINDPQNGVRKKLAVLLDRCEPSEAELIGAILGLCGITALSRAPASVDWHCDNLPILQGATIHLKKWQSLNWSRNGDAELHSPGLWQIWSLLADGLAINGVHSPGHSGIKENEACDKACRWLSRDGSKLLSRFGEGYIGRQAALNAQHAWVLVDGRDFQKLAQTESQPDLAAEDLRARIAPYMADISVKTP